MPFQGPSIQRVACGPEIALGFHSAMSQGIFQAYTTPTENKINNDSPRTTAYGPEGLCGHTLAFSVYEQLLFHIFEELHHQFTQLK